MNTNANMNTDTDQLAISWYDGGDELPEGSILFLDSAHGVYIPQNFAETVNREFLFNVDMDDMSLLLEGPEEEWYWEAWDNVCQGALIRDSSGKEYTLHQDGDLWLIPVETDS